VKIARKSRKTARNSPFVSKENNNHQKHIGMTLKDIAIFKHFIADKDLRKPFCSVYRQSQNWAKLPTNIEEYFANVEPLNVIIKAMRICKPNSAFGYDFWQDLHQDWKEYYEKVSSSNFIQNDDGRLERLEGYYSMLRENWNDKDKPWRYEPIDDAKVRLGLATEKPKEDIIPEKPAIEEEEEADDLDIEFVDFDKTTRISTGLTRGIISVNTRSHSWKITVNHSDTKEIQNKNVGFARVGQTKTGDVMMMFCNNSSGIPIVMNADRYYNINSRQFVEHLHKLLNIKDDLVYLHIEKVSDKTDSITYKVTK
jgi:hypothetical protein